MKPYLLVVPAGPGAMFEKWEDYSKYNFDLAVLQWNDGPRLPNTENAKFYENDRGQKFHMIAKFNEKYDLSDYEYIWLMDDDCITTAENIEKTFYFCKENNIDIAQPSLTPNSYYYWEPTKQILGAKMHKTNTVEIMCPMFSQRCWPEASALFDMLPLGSGMELEVFWRITFQTDHGTTKYGGLVAVIDQLPVYHSKPVTTPEQWAIRGVDPGDDARWLHSAGYRGMTFETIEVVY